MKTLAIALITAFGLFIANAQEHLEPEAGPLSGKDDYSVKLREVFAAAYEGNVVARAIITPSFQKEEVVGIRKNDKGYQAFSVTPSSPFWDTYSIWARETGIDKVKDVDGKIIPPEKQDDLKKMKERSPSDFKNIKTTTQSAFLPAELEKRIEKLWQNAARC